MGPASIVGKSKHFLEEHRRCLDQSELLLGLITDQERLWSIIPFLPEALAMTWEIPFRMLKQNCIVDRQTLLESFRGLNKINQRNGHVFSQRNGRRLSAVDWNPRFLKTLGGAPHERGLRTGGRCVPCAAISSHWTSTRLPNTRTRNEAERKHAERTISQKRNG